MLRKIKKTYRGLEVTKSEINTVKIALEPSGWRLLNVKSVALPEDVISFSYRNKNVNKPDQFLSAVKEAFSDVKGKETDIGVALPNEVLKVSIQSFGDLPDNDAGIEKMASWKMERQYNFRTNSTKTAFHRIGKVDGHERLFVTSGNLDVIRDYEDLLKKVGLNSTVILPSGISQFNFYAKELSDKGIIAYIGLFNNFFTFYVFKNSVLIFYQGLKKSVGSDSYLEEIDMCFEYYLSQYPDDEIEKLCIGGFTGKREDIYEIFSSFENSDIIVVNEAMMIGKGDNLDLSGKEGEIAAFATAIGAAQGMKK